MMYVPMECRFTIYSLFLDIHNLSKDIHNVFMDILNSFMDILQQLRINRIMDIQY